jgi:hypothetical protein
MDNWERKQHNEKMERAANQSAQGIATQTYLMREHNKILKEQQHAEILRQEQAQLSAIKDKMGTLEIQHSQASSAEEKAIIQRQYSEAEGEYRYCQQQKAERIAAEAKAARQRRMAGIVAAVTSIIVFVAVAVALVYLSPKITQPTKQSVTKQSTINSRQIKMINYVGWDVNKAVEELILKYNVEESRIKKVLVKSDTTAAGKIIKQSPKKDSLFDLDGTAEITFTVSEGSEATMPSYMINGTSTKKVTAIKAELHNLGVPDANVTVTYTQTLDQTLDDYVINSTPVQGKKFKITDTKIVLTVQKFDSVGASASKEARSKSESKSRSEAAAKAAESSAVQKQQTTSSEQKDLDLAAIQKGDVSTLVGTWKNGTGETLIINSDGTVGSSMALGSASYYEDTNMLTMDIGPKSGSQGVGGAVVFLLKIGVVNPHGDQSDTQRPRLIMTQSGLGNQSSEQYYYRE